MELSRTTKYCIVGVVLVSALAPIAIPLLLRELVVKRCMKQNNYLNRTDIPKACPEFEQIAHDSVLKDFDYQRYSGIWYTFASNDPTQPKGACLCDRFDWQIQKKHFTFRVRLDTLCKAFSTTHLLLTLWLEGKVNATGQMASMLEGAPSIGATLIPNFVLWVNEDYSACVRYSCQENYLGAPVFASLQIWTRTPVSSESEQGKALLRQAHQLVDFRDEYIEFGDHRECDGLPTLHHATKMS